MEQTTQTHTAQPVQQGEQVTSVGNWIGTMFLLCIPIVNIILPIIWAVSAESASKRNFFRAYWVMVGVAVVLTIVAVIIAAAAGATLMNLTNFMY